MRNGPERLEQLFWDNTERSEAEKYLQRWYFWVPDQAYRLGHDIEADRRHRGVGVRGVEVLEECKEIFACRVTARHDVLLELVRLHATVRPAPDGIVRSEAFQSHGPAPAPRAGGFRRGRVATRLHLGLGVAHIERTEDGFSVIDAAGARWQLTELILAVPARDGARLLAGVRGCEAIHRTLTLARDYRRGSTFP